MKKSVFIALTMLVLALTLTSAGCSASTDAGAQPESSAPENSGELMVSTAGTLSDAFTEIAEEFEAQTGVHVTLNVAASGVLQKQIEEGAPVDVFASASPTQIDALVTGGFVSVEDAATFASNSVALITLPGDPLDMSDLGGLSLARVLTTGNPKTAPHGTRAFEVLESLGVRGELESRFVFAENAAQTVDYVARGEADAGLVFTTEVLGRDDVEIIDTAPAAMHKPIHYVIAPVLAAEQPELAAKFQAFVLGEAGRSILAVHGFILAEVPE